MKTLLKLAIVLIVLAIAGVVGAFFYIDAIAKAAVEKGSTYALGVDTKLDSAKVKIFDGRFIMRGLNVANPTGYQTPHFLTLGRGDVAVTLGSLTRDIVELPHLKLHTIDINLEKKDGKSNYQVILDNLKKLESGTSTPSTESGKRYIIRHLTITKANVHVDTFPGGGKLARLDVPLDAIDLKNIGSDTGKGVLLSDLAGVILKAILGAAVNKGGDVIPKDVLGDLSGQLAGLKDIGNIVDVKNLPKDLGNIGDKTKEGVSKTIGNLLGGDKKDK